MSNAAENLAPIAILHPDLPTLAAEVAALRQRVAALEAQLGPGTAQAAGPDAEAVTAQPAVIAVEPLADAEVPQWLPARRDQPQAEVNALLAALFALCLKVKSQDLHESLNEFEQFKSLTHSARKGSPLLNQELFSYKWKPVVQRVGQYLSNPTDPTSFAVSSMQPTKLDNKTEQVRLFLRAEKRMPPPITLRRDEQAGGALRIDAMSL